MSFWRDRADLFIRQRKELAEILVDWETGNQYTVYDARENELAHVAEKKGGISRFLRRGFLRSHRPFEVSVLDREGHEVLHLSRPFFFLFSSLDVRGGDGRRLGNAERRFGLLYKRYDLLAAGTCRIEYGDAARTEDQRAIILAAAISIDFDLFENNQGSGGVLDFAGSRD